MKEVVDKDLDVITALTESVAELTLAVKTQNDVVLCLLHKFNTEADIPRYQTKEAFEKDMGEKVQTCVEAVRKIYGHGETNKS